MRNKPSEPYSGVWPIVPTPFKENGTLDLESQKRVLDCMIDQGSDGLCILANYSEQFALADDERTTLTKLCLEHVAGRVPVIVTCSHYATDVVLERCRFAKDYGAAMIMLMPPYHGAVIKGSEQQTFEQFARVNDVGIPMMIQDAPVSGVSMSIELLTRVVLEIENIKYLKIEQAQNAAKIKAVVNGCGKSLLGALDGEGAITLIPDLDAGATGTMPSALLPDLIKQIVTLYQTDDRETAAQRHGELLPLINFESTQCDLRGCKTILKAGGVIKSDSVRHPGQALNVETKTELLRLAKQVNPLALNWGR